MDTYCTHPLFFVLYREADMNDFEPPAAKRTCPDNDEDSNLESCDREAVS